VFDRWRRLDEGVRRTRETFFGRLARVFDRQALTDALWEELEELLIAADVSVPVATALIEAAREQVRREGIRDSARARDVLVKEMVRVLRTVNGTPGLALRTDRLNVILIIGVNGTGKTTTIGKLAHALRESGRSVVVAAADTFRAAAIEQLKVWAERAQVPVVAHQPGSDPGAVVFDAWQAARARGADVLLVDTAGRLHTKYNLMEELKKIRRVLARQDPTAPHEVLLVLDATTGQNGLAQAQHFTEAVGVTGLVLTKVDGTAKGGVAFAIAHALKLPIKYLGTGEQLDDLVPFDAQEYVQALLGQAA
jgi:fused signal recognition particle receptor